MSTIGSLLLAMDPGILPYNQQELTQSRIRSGQLTNETSLLALQEAKRQQEAQQAFMHYVQQHPEQFLGGGGGSLIGSLGPAGAPPGGAPGSGPGQALTQQPFAPGLPSQAPQLVPGGQDLSRFAGVSPQVGGPIPPDVMGQGMPSVTPPQSTIGSLGPMGGAPGQPQVNPIEQLMRQNPDAAFAVMQRQQGQQDQSMKRQEQRLTIGTKVAEWLGRESQGVTDQASLEALRQQAWQIAPQAAAQLPQVYSKEAMLPFIKQAVDVATNAKLQLETWKNQIEEQKLGVQLANAGYQGLGTEVTGILRGLTPAQVEQFGGRVSPAAIAYATEQEKQRKLAQARETELQRGKTEAELRGDKTVSEALGGKATNLFNTQTGAPVDTRMKVKEYEALPAGAVRELSEDNRKQMETINSVMPTITQLQKHLDALYGPGGVLARMTSDERAELANAPERWAKQYAQKYPELAAAQRFVDANASALARALAGERGAMSEGDVERAKALLPSLTTSLNVWPPNKLAMQAPDTRGVALRTMNDMVDMINARTARLLGNPQFQHPELHRYQTAEEAQRAAGGPVTPPQVAPPALPIPPTVGLNPQWRAPGTPAPEPGAAPAPAGPTLGYPRPERYVPGEGTSPALPPEPSTRPTPPTATSTPAQDEAYRQSQGQGTSPAPAPSSPAARPTPGRQSQAPPAAGQTRVALAGAPKMMELSDVAEAMRQTGKSRREVEAAARAKGYTVYGSKLPLPGESRMATSRTPGQGDNPQLAAMVNTIAEQARRRGEDPRMAVQRWAQSVGIA